MIERYSFILQDFLHEGQKYGNAMTHEKKYQTNKVSVNFSNYFYESFPCCRCSNGQKTSPEKCKLCLRIIAKAHRRLRWALCLGFLHIKCGNVQLKGYQQLLQDKNTWKCPDCVELPELPLLQVLGNENQENNQYEHEQAEQNANLSAILDIHCSDSNLLIQRRKDPRNVL